MISVLYSSALKSVLVVLKSFPRRASLGNFFTTSTASAAVLQSHNSSHKLSIIMDSNTAGAITKRRDVNMHLASDHAPHSASAADPRMKSAG